MRGASPSIVTRSRFRSAAAMASQARPSNAGRAASHCAINSCSAMRCTGRLNSRAMHLSAKSLRAAMLAGIPFMSCGRRAVIAA